MSECCPAGAAPPPEESITDRVVTNLQRQILTGKIPIGARLRHDAVAEEFGVSRTPVREALRVLHTQGIITIIPNRGARVNGHSSGDMQEIAELRAQLEGYAAEVAAERMNDLQTKRMHEAWREFGTAISDLPTTDEAVERRASELWATSNAEFHAVIVEASGSRQLVLMLAELKRRLPHNLSYGAHSGNTRLLRRNLSEHENIAKAINAHDARRARKLMSEHILKSWDATARWMESRGPVREIGWAALPSTS